MSAPLTVVISGATGLIGRALVAECNDRGFRVVALARNVERAKNSLSGKAAVVRYSLGDAEVALPDLQGAAAVVNLAGESLFKPFTGRGKLRRATMERVAGTERLASACSRSPVKPQVFIQASSVGVYGFGSPKDEEVSETMAPLDDEYSVGSRAWEDAAIKNLGDIRSVLIRLGYVLAKDGGGLPRQIAQARKGKVSFFAPGRQWLPWIQLDDVVSVIVSAIEDATWQGPYNVVAPDSVTAESFARALAVATGASQPKASPRFLARVFVGAGAATVLDGRNVVPRRLIERRFPFRHPNLGEALVELCTPC